MRMKINVALVLSIDNFTIRARLSCGNLPRRHRRCLSEHKTLKGITEIELKRPDTRPTKRFKQIRLTLIIKTANSKKHVRQTRNNNNIVNRHVSIHTGRVPPFFEAR